MPRTAPLLPKTAGIYTITNLLTGKVYIGSALNLRHRCCTHFSQLKHNRHYNAYLQNAYNKYKKDAFVFTILEHWEGLNEQELLKKEQAWLDKTPSSQKYNIRIVANSNYGISPSPETRKLISAAKKGIPRSDELKDKISGPNHYAYGKSLYGEQATLIIELLQNGVSLRGVAKRVGGSSSGLRQFLATVTAREPDSKFAALVDTVVGNRDRRRAVMRGMRIARGSKCDCHRNTIMRMLAHGHTRGEVARHLDLSPNTLLHYLRGQAKFGCRTSYLAVKEVTKWPY